MVKLIQPQIGMTLYGYCQGYFGRDGYDDKRIEVIGFDYIVVRTINGPDLLDTQEWRGKVPESWTKPAEDYDE